MRRQLLATMTAMALGSFPVQAQAFGYEGHALVCGLAYDALTEHTRTAVDRLTARSGLGKPFPDLCSWPDEIRSEEQWKYTGPWHYVNVARSDTRITLAHCPDKGCVLSAIATMEARLQSAPQTDWQALLFLGHFIGDVHQPMHVSYGDDRGGNRFPLFWEGEPTNLHAIWDRQIPGLSPSTRQNRADFRGQMSDVEAQVGPEAPLNWAQESLNRTLLIYRQYHQGENLSEQDVLGDRLWLQAQMVKAAKRLAATLETLLGPGKNPRKNPGGDPE